MTLFSLLENALKEYGEKKFGTSLENLQKLCSLEIPGEKKIPRKRIIRKSAKPIKHYQQTLLIEEKIEVRLPVKNKKVRKDEIKRIQARRKFNHIAKERGLVCRWCGRSLVRLKTLLKKHQVSQLTQDGKVIYTVNGKNTWDWIATIDHIAGIKTQVANDEHYLVLSCYPCNHTRGIEKIKEKNGNKT